MTKKQDLINFINAAKIHKTNYIAVVVETRGSKQPEIIINPLENFDQKSEYYNKAYSDDLVLNTFDGIRIVGYVAGDTLAKIEENLATN